MDVSSINTARLSYMYSTVMLNIFQVKLAWGNTPDGGSSGDLQFAHAGRGVTRSTLITPTPSGQMEGVKPISVSYGKPSCFICLFESQTKGKGRESRLPPKPHGGADDRTLHSHDSYPYNYV